MTKDFYFGCAAGSAIYFLLIGHAAAVVGLVACMLGLLAER